MPLPSQPTYIPHCWQSWLQTPPIFHGCSFISFQHFCNTAGCIYRNAFLGTQETRGPHTHCPSWTPSSRSGPSPLLSPPPSQVLLSSRFSFSFGLFFLCPPLMPTSCSHQPSPLNCCLLGEPKNPLTSPLIDFLSHWKQKEVLICDPICCPKEDTARISMNLYRWQSVSVTGYKDAHTVGSGPGRSQYESGSHHLLISALMPDQ